MRFLGQAGRAVGEADARADIGNILFQLNLHLWLNFGETKRGCKTIRKVQSGLLTLGNGEPPPMPKSEPDDVSSPSDGDFRSDLEPDPSEVSVVPDGGGQKEHGRFTNGNHGERGA